MQDELNNQSEMQDELNNPSEMQDAHKKNKAHFSALFMYNLLG